MQKFFQCTYEAFIEPLTHLFHLSLTQGIVPDELKIGKVVPICKGADE